MNKSEQLVNLLKSKPLSSAEINTALGYKFSRTQIDRMVKSGVLEKFEDINENSEKRWSRVVVTKYKAVRDYVNRSKRDGYTAEGVLAKYAKILRQHGYVVTPPNLR